MLIAAAPPIGENMYGWTVSSSTTDPCVNTGSFQPGLVELHLWYAYNANDGLSAAEMSAIVAPPGALDLVGFTPLNGFFAYGTVTQLELAVGGCPDAPILVGTWVGVATAANWEVCLGGDSNWSVDCELGSAPTPNETRGFANNTTPTCLPGIDELCPPELSTDGTSWGLIKALYR